MFPVNMLTNATEVEFKKMQVWCAKVQSHQGRKRASFCPGGYTGTVCKACLRLGSDNKGKEAQMDAEHKSPRDPINICKEQWER